MIREEEKDYLEGNSVEPEVVIKDGHIECKYGCEGEHSYAVSTENGKIVDKGRFTDAFDIDISHLDQGLYQITIFDAMQRYSVSFHVK